jgi:hypothetical protein
MRRTELAANVFAVMPGHLKFFYKTKRDVNLNEKFNPPGSPKQARKM